VKRETLGRDEARAIYEEIVRTRRDPALLEYIGRGAFQARIFPIPLGGGRAAAWRAGLPRRGRPDRARTARGDLAAAQMETRQALTNAKMQR
jgi:hypothetical protein